MPVEIARVPAPPQPPQPIKYVKLRSDFSGDNAISVGMFDGSWHPVSGGKTLVTPDSLRQFANALLEMIGDK